MVGRKNRAAERKANDYINYLLKAQIKSFIMLKQFFYTHNVRLCQHVEVLVLNFFSLRYSCKLWLTLIKFFFFEKCLLSFLDLNSNSISYFMNFTCLSHTFLIIFQFYISPWIHSEHMTNIIKFKYQWQGVRTWFFFFWQI
jgi:hypothetical protein